jgi:ATP-binding protein involved in chromosome partitioning
MTVTKTRRMVRPAAARESTMALSKEQIVETLARIAAPDGRPLPQTGALSEVVVTDGKVFFSLTVDAAAV